MTAIDHYSACLRRLRDVQNLHCEATYSHTTEKKVIAGLVALLEQCKREVSEALVKLNESILESKT